MNRTRLKIRFSLIRKHWKAIIPALAAIMLMFGLIALVSGEGMRRGIVIDGTDISGLEFSDARSILLDHINDKYPENFFSLICGTREWKFKLDDISYAFLLDDALSKAYMLGRTGSFLQRLSRDFQLFMKGQSLDIGVTYDKPVLKDILENVKKELDKEAVSASVAYNSGKVVYRQGSYGTSLDIDRNVKLVENQLSRKYFKDIKLEPDIVRPRVALDDVKDIDCVLSSFSTKFNRGDANRSDNIRLACSRLNGLVLLPGDEFSMNDALGPRTLDNGYKEAPIIFENELVPGTGGGVCQVTTTLYDTVLLAGLDVLERTHHSMPLGYVQPGQDATIAEGNIDFKFRNNLGCAVCLSTEVKADTIYIRILGKSSLKSRIYKLIPEITGEYPPGEDEIAFDDNIPFGEKVVEREPRKGIKAVLYRNAYSKDGRLLEHEKISEDYYKPLNGLVKINSSYYDEYLLTLLEVGNE